MLEVQSGIKQSFENNSEVMKAEKDFVEGKVWEKKIGKKIQFRLNCKLFNLLGIKFLCQVNYILLILWKKIIYLQCIYLLYICLTHYCPQEPCKNKLKTNPLWKN